ncbi:MAG: hypothetical protein ABSE59_05180 [Opitutaceae bacterium]|jgi:acyl carrier protein
MKSTPKAIAEEIKKLISNWEILAKNDSLGGSSLAEFQALAQDSLNARTKIVELEAALKEQIRARDIADVQTHAEYLRIVNAIRSDRKFGPNSDFYKALGYVPKRARIFRVIHGNSAATGASS